MLPRIVLCIAFFSALSGCTAGVGPDAPPTSAPDEAAVVEYKIRCPTDGGQPPETGVCRDTLTAPTTYLEEPYAAIRTGPNGTLAVAANGGAPGAEGDERQTRLSTIALFLSEDHGTSWRTVELPPAPLPGLVIEGDPALAYHADGTLHVVGLVVDEAAVAASALGLERAPRNHVFHTATSDQGSSWETTVLFGSTGANDRPWVTAAPDGLVFIVWYDIEAEAPSLAWRSPGDDEWTVIPPTAFPNQCRTPSPIALVERSALLACYVPDEATHVLEVLPEDGRVQEISSFPTLCGLPRVLSAPSGKVVMTCYAGPLLESLDGGLTWRSIGMMQERTGIEDAWTDAFVYWSDLDEHGGLHVLLTPYRSRVYDAQSVSQSAYPVAHVVLDTAAWRAVSETLLVADVQNATSPPDRTMGDDFGSIVLTPEGGLLFWASDGSIEFTSFVARPAGT